MSDKLRAAAKAALDVMQLARRDHGTIMLSYPAIESWSYHRVDQRLDDAIKAVEDALAEPAIKESLTVAEQEPVAWKHPNKNMVFWEDTKEVDEYHGFKPTIPLYPAPPRREWVGLTDREFQPMIQKAMAYYGYDQSEPSHLTAGAGFRVFAYAIEAKLREKNT